MAELIVICFCVLLNALLASAEMAFVSVSKSSLRQLAKIGDKNAGAILILRDNPERTLSVVQIGITLVGALGAAVGGAGAEEWLSPIFETNLGISENFAEVLSVALVVLPLTYFMVVAGELVPKAIALRDPMLVVLKAAKWFALLDKFFGPIVTVFERSTKLLLRLFFRRDRTQTEAPPAFSSEMAEHMDKLSPQHRTYVLNLVNIEKEKIRDIMLPWKQVVNVNVNLNASEVETVVISCGHTRLPVLQDRKAIGVLNTKEFVALTKTGETDWTKIIRPSVQIAESESLLYALRLMQERRSHLAVVTSGATLLGIVTLEDIIEEVIGDVYDEDDDGALRQILGASPKIRSMRL